MYFFENAYVTLLERVSKIYTRKTDIIRYTPRKWHGFVYYLTGHCDYVYPYTEFIAEPGSFIYLPYGQSYEIHPTVDSSCILINFSTADKDIGTGAFTSVFRNNSRLQNYFLSAVTAYRGKRIGYISDVTSTLYKIISLIQAEQTDFYLPSHYYTKIEPAVEYIAKHYRDEQITVSSLAHAAGISSKYFTTLFSGYFGITPKQYIINQKIDLAKSILSSEKISVSEIADICGFSNVYYFSKLFKSNTGLTPSKYREISIV